MLICVNTYVCTLRKFQKSTLRPTNKRDFISERKEKKLRRERGLTLSPLLEYPSDPNQEKTVQAQITLPPIIRKITI